MLHAFNAKTGNELFAYVPNAIFPQLASLTNPDNVHQPYVDAIPTVSEAKVGSKWKTVLIGGFGGGAQGLFALDVSNPAAFGADNVLWEFMDKDDADMGNVVGEVLLARFRVKEYEYRPCFWKQRIRQANARQPVRSRACAAIPLSMTVPKPINSTVASSLTRQAMQAFPAVRSAGEKLSIFALCKVRRKK